MIIERDNKGRITKNNNNDKKGLHIAGRKTIITQDVVQKLEYAFSIGSTDVEACSFAGIAKQTLYNFMEKNPEFVDRRNDLKNAPILKSRATLVKNLDNPLWAFKYLERKLPKEFGQNIKLTDGEGQPLNIGGQTINNQLTLVLENVEPATRKQYIDKLRGLFTQATSRDCLPLQPSDAN